MTGRERAVARSPLPLMSAHIPLDQLRREIGRSSLEPWIEGPAPARSMSAARRCFNAAPSEFSRSRHAFEYEECRETVEANRHPILKVDIN